MIHLSPSARISTQTGAGLAFVNSWPPWIAKGRKVGDTVSRSHPQHFSLLLHVQKSAKKNSINTHLDLASAKSCHMGFECENLLPGPDSLSPFKSKILGIQRKSAFPSLSCSWVWFWKWGLSGWIWLGVMWTAFGSHLYREVRALSLYKQTQCRGLECRCGGRSHTATLDHEKKTMCARWQEKKNR